MYTSAERSQRSSSEDTPPLAPVEESGAFNQAILDEISDFIVSIPDLAETEEQPLPGLAQPEPSVTPSAFENEVQQWHQYLTQAAQNIASSYEGALAYTCGLAAGLHLATTSAVAAHPSRLQTQTQELFTAMSNLPDEAWDAFQMLHVRM